MRRGVWTSVVMVALFVALTVACSGAVTLQFVTFAWQDAELEQVQTLVDEWNAAHPDIQVNIVSLLLENIDDYLLTGFQAGQGPDLFHEEPEMAYEYGLQGYAEPLNRYLDAATLADISQNNWEGVSDDRGNIYAVPFLQEDLVIFYNKTMFANAGITPPADGLITWDQLRECALRLTQRDANGQTTTWGLLAPLEQRLWWTLVAENDGHVLVKHDDGTWHVEIDAAARQAIQFFTNLVTVDHVMPQDILSYDFMTLFQGFQSGEYAMFSFGCWVRSWIERLTKLDWGMLQVKGPVRTVTESGPQCISIYSGSSHKDEAAQFLLWYTNTENQALLAHADGLFPVRGSALARPEFQTTDDQWNVAYEFMAYAQDVKPHMFGFYGWEWQSFVPQIELTINGTESLDKALQAATDDGNAFLRRLGLQ